MLKRQGDLGLIAAFVLIASTVAAQSSDAQQTPSPQKFPRISASVLEHVMAAAEGRPSGSLIGLHHMNGDSRQLSIVSMRVAIAGLAAQAIERGSRYTPTESVLTGDAVFIECGDPALFAGFDCASLRVTTPTGQRIDPVGYVAGPQTVRNELAGKWTVSRAAGTFRVSDLQHGFTVTYVGTDDSEFTYPVSAGDAAHELLLSLGEPQPSPVSGTSTDPGPQGPPLRLGLELLPDGWILSNQSLSRWTGCVAAVGGSMVDVPVLGVGGVVTLKYEQFSPALDFDAPNIDFTFSVTCKVAEVTAVTPDNVPARF